MVYIREAHPDDGWQVAQNRRDGVIVNDPKTDAERRKVAQDFAKQFSIKIPIYLDEMDDAANKAFAAWPDRIFVIGQDGTVAFKTAPGPAGFKPDEMLPVLEKIAKSEPTAAGTALNAQPLQKAPPTPPAEVRQAQ